MIATLTAVLVIVKAFYSWATYKRLRANEAVLGEMERQREDSRAGSSLSSVLASHLNALSEILVPALNGRLQPIGRDIPGVIMHF